MKDREALPSQNGDRVALLHELIEALTALGNYLAVIQRELDNQPALKQEVFEEAIRKSFAQHDRACEAIRRLQAQPP
jgi:hypothetical protein